ncbi:unnamed protein product, partial [Allacma fusca]
SGRAGTGKHLRAAGGYGPKISHGILIFAGRLVAYSAG